MRATLVLATTAISALSVIPATGGYANTALGPPAAMEIPAPTTTAVLRADASTTPSTATMATHAQRTLATHRCAPTRPSRATTTTRAPPTPAHPPSAASTPVPRPAHAPGEVAHIVIASNKALLSWDQAPGTPMAVYDLVRGRTDQFPVGTGAAETSVICGHTFTIRSDYSVPPAGVGLWYDVRGRTGCGAGPYGMQSNGLPRTTSVCP